MAVAQDESVAGVSVIIPAYNYERYLAEAVDSALDQDFAGPLEVLIIDDGSTDNTGLVAARYADRVRYHRKPNAGLSAARNTGLEMAKHRRVLFLDADDILEPSCVRRLVEVWEASLPPPVVVGSASRMIDGEGRFAAGAEETAHTQTVKRHDVRDFVLRNRFAPIVLAQRDVLLDLGGFDPELRASEDRDMWIRAATRGLMLHLDEALHRKRDHGSNMSRQADRQTNSILQVLAKAEANAQVQLKQEDWRQARSVCYYQSARMHLAAGNVRKAREQCLRSLRECPWMRNPGAAAMPAMFRSKFLLLLLMRQMRQPWEASRPER